LSRIFRQTPLYCPAQHCRHGRRNRIGILTHDRRHRFGDAPALECTPPCEHLVHHKAERELVTAMVHLLPSRLLGAHVGSRAHDRTRNAQHGCGFIGRAHRRCPLCQPEIKYLHRGIAGQQYVRRLQVTMNEAGRMGRRQSTGDLNGRIQHFPDVVERMHRLTIDILHYYVIVTDIVNLGYIRMVQGGNCASLVLETL
jgi:hypothetical protein